MHNPWTQTVVSEALEEGMEWGGEELIGRKMVQSSFEFLLEIANVPNSSQGMYIQGFPETPRSKDNTETQISEASKSKLSSLQTTPLTTMCGGGGGREHTMKHLNKMLLVISISVLNSGGPLGAC